MGPGCSSRDAKNPSIYIEIKIEEAGNSPGVSILKSNCIHEIPGDHCFDPAALLPLRGK